MKSETAPRPKKNCELILALDMGDKEEALDLLDRIGNQIDWVKVGLQMFTRWGPVFLDEVASRGYRIFLDLKLHDISNTVAKTIQSLAHHPVEMLTLHASGGPEMISAAKDARDNSATEAKLIAVTVLTSINEGILKTVGLQGPIPERVTALGRMAVESGADGLVCSPLELGMLRQSLGDIPLLITPGIRPAGSDMGDQKRVMTPTDAANAGSSFIVVGRPILRADDPQAATMQIWDELTSTHPNHE